MHQVGNYCITITDVWYQNPELRYHHYEIPISNSKSRHHHCRLPPLDIILWQLLPLPTSTYSPRIDLGAFLHSSRPYLLSVSLSVTENSCIDVEYIYGFVWWGGLQTKSMTSQRNRATHKMADMRYYGNVMTTTRWRLYVTMETLWQQQDGGCALLWKRYHDIQIT